MQCHVMISGIILFTNFDVYAVLGVENIVFRKWMLIYAILAVNVRVFLHYFT